jgi:hypothetical protein
VNDYKIYLYSQGPVAMPVILAIWEAEIGRIEFRGLRPAQAEFTDPISKITRAKWTGDVAQAVEP